MILLTFGAIGILGAGLVGYGVGYRRGMKNRKFDLSGRPETVFAYYLKRERWRHLEDIHAIDRDLRRLKGRGIVPPDLPMDVWLNVQAEGRKA